MIFNDDSMLDFRGNGFGDSIFGYDAGEVVITGRVPGALYVDDFSDGEYGLQHIQPLEFSQNELNGIIALEVTDQASASGMLEDTPAPVVEPTDSGNAGEDNGAALVAANDDDTPAAIVALTHHKGEEALIPTTAGDSDLHLGVVDVQDLHDLAIPPIPQSSLEAPTVTVTPPSLDDDAAPVIFGRAYQSLSFLIIDTPFAVGDNQLPDSLRPSLNDLLGLTTPAGQEDNDGQAFVMPARSWVLH